jgi:hypothetical protein
MKEYNIEVIEVLKDIITVTASSKEMAIAIVKDRYFDEEIVLDYGAFDSVEFNVFEE